MSIRGQGDRWLAGEPVDGVELEQYAPVQITSGPYAGQTGTVALLLNLQADPLYLVTLAFGAGDVRVRQSALRRVIAS
jgi:hypothetical protein